MNIEYKPFYELVQIDMENLRDGIRQVVREWTAKELASGFNTPFLEHFLDQYPEWNHAELYDTIEAEMNRVSGVVT